MNKLGIVGASGAVGREIIKVLKRRRFPIAGLKLLASSRSAGKEIEWAGQALVVEKLTADSFFGLDMVLFSAGSDVSKAYAPLAVKAGCVVIDNSSAFRMDSEVPLVIPEINPGDIQSHRGIIANPNCTTAITLMALYPLHQAFGVTRIFASSYQAVSGSGAKGVDELMRQASNIFYKKAIDVQVYPHQIMHNVIPKVDACLLTGYTKEEMKMQSEGRKIMHHRSFLASVTCVRVPVLRAHCIAVSAEFERPVTAEAAREILLRAPGIDVVDAPEKDEYPVPLNAAEKDNCQVGRIRQDCALENGICFWVCGDQLLKGAALNAVQIAELL